MNDEPGVFYEKLMSCYQGPLLNTGRILAVSATPGLRPIGKFIKCRQIPLIVNR